MSIIPLHSYSILGPNLIFVRGLVKFVPAVARLVCPDLLDYVLQTLISGPVVEISSDYEERTALRKQLTAQRGVEGSFWTLVQRDSWFKLLLLLSFTPASALRHDT